MINRKLQLKYEIILYRFMLFLRKTLRKLGSKRRYLVLGPRLDERICQKLFDELSVPTKKYLIDEAYRASHDKLETVIPVFLHIPKCAGISIGQLFKCNVSVDDWYGTIERPDDGYQNDYFRYGINNPGLKMIQGHFDIRLLDVIERPHKAFTFLREPINRTVSFFYYLKDWLFESFHIDKNMTLKQIFATEYSYLFENLQVRYLCGKPTESLTRQDLQCAKDNLGKYFVFVGTVETIQDDIKELGRIFNFPTTNLQILNTGKDRPALEALSTQEREVIQKNNLLDIELYKYALSKRRDQIDCVVSPLR